jgi:hypothetical protein
LNRLTEFSSVDRAELFFSLLSVLGHGWPPSPLFAH